MVNFYIWNTKTNEVIEDSSATWLICASRYLPLLGAFYMVDNTAFVGNSEDRYGRAYLDAKLNPSWKFVTKGKEGFPKEFQLALLLLGVQ